MTEEWQKRDASDEKEKGVKDGRTGYSGDSSGRRDGVRYAVRLIGRGLLSLLVLLASIDARLARLSSIEGVETNGERYSRKIPILSSSDRRGIAEECSIIGFFTLLFWKTFTFREIVYANATIVIKTRM